MQAYVQDGETFLRTIDDYIENYYRLFMANRKPPVGPRPAPAKVSSEALLGARGELVITHKGREYRLRITQNGKLILTA
jgi:hemin uptake protein HemP